MQVCVGISVHSLIRSSGPEVNTLPEVQHRMLCMCLDQALHRYISSRRHHLLDASMCWNISTFTNTSFRVRGCHITCKFNIACCACAWIRLFIGTFLQTAPSPAMQVCVGISVQSLIRSVVSRGCNTLPVTTASMCWIIRYILQGKHHLLQCKYVLEYQYNH